MSWPIWGEEELATQRTKARTGGISERKPRKIRRKSEKLYRARVEPYAMQGCGSTEFRLSGREKRNCRGRKESYRGGPDRQRSGWDFILSVRGVTEGL